MHKEDKPSAEEIGRGRPKKNSQKIHKKPLDKCPGMWYNIYVKNKGKPKKEIYI
jgi:hypothetical protein